MRAMPVRPTPAVLVVGAGYLVAVGLIVLWPRTVTGAVDGILARLSRWVPLGGELLEFSANVALFIPAGLLAGMMLPVGRRWVGVVGAAVASLAIELVQGVLLPERVASIIDVIANTSGAILGVLLARLVNVPSAGDR